MDLYDINMVTNTNLKYTNSSSNYYVIMMLHNLEKKNLIENFQFFYIPEAEVPS